MQTCRQVHEARMSAAVRSRRVLTAASDGRLCRFVTPGCAGAALWCGMVRFLLPLLLLLGACTPDPAADHLLGHGDPVRAAALNAPRLLGDTARLAGDPARAARATVQLEVLADAFEADPRYRHEVSGATLHAVRLGRAELRQAIGIAPDAPAEVVIALLRDAAEALDAGRIARAEAALSGPAFPAGPAATLSRLGALPRLPRVSEAAAAAQGEIARLDARSTPRG